jgi:hypothetical protein
MSPLLVWPIRISVSRLRLKAPTPAQSPRIAALPHAAGRGVSKPKAGCCGLLCTPWAVLSENDRERKRDAVRFLETFVILASTYICAIFIPSLELVYRIIGATGGVSPALPRFDP